MAETGTSIPTGAPLAEGEALAAEWAAMAGGEAPPAAGVKPGRTGADASPEGEQGSRVLNQDEIDSLLGFDAGARGQNPSTGITSLLNSTLVSYERLPMLEVVFDRLVRMLSTSLRNFTSDNVEVVLDGLSSTRFGNYLNSIPQPAMIVVFKAEEWENYGLLIVDSALTFAVVDVLLGGRRGSAATRLEGRAYTTIERNLVERMIRIVLGDMSAAFEPLSPVRFGFERLETNPRFAAIVRPANAAILVRLTVDMVGRGGQIEVVLPYATLEPIRDLLLQMFVGEKFGRDSIWEAHLATALWSTDVEIEAVLDEVALPFKQAANLEVGQTVMLGASPSSAVTLRCGNVRLLTGEMGRVGKSIAVRVHAPLTAQPGQT